MQELLWIALQGNVASVEKLPEEWFPYADSIMQSEKDTIIL